MIVTQPKLRADLIALENQTRLIAADGISYELATESTVVRALELFDGQHSWNKIVKVFDDQEVAGQFVSWVRENDLVKSSSKPFAGLRIRLYGANQLASLIAHQLVDLGIKQLTVIDGTPTELDIFQTRAEALIADLQKSGTTTQICLDDHWLLAGSLPDLAIVAGPGVEPDRAVLDILHRCGVATLVVTAHHDSARVGPFLVPKFTPCWRCDDLVQCEYDPKWPLASHILSKLPPRPEPYLASWAANQAVLQLISFTASGSSDLFNLVLHWNGTNPGLQYRKRDRHSRCNCQILEL